MSDRIQMTGRKINSSKLHKTAENKVQEQRATVPKNGKYDQNAKFKNS
jgi:hypothetical protein